jgi:hypothetical protein
MTAPQIRHLTGTGWTTWEHAAAHLHGCATLWTDINGLHHGDPPDRQPIGATHLWAWRPGTRLRLRFDGHEIALAALHDEPGPGTIPVPTRQHPGQPWGNYERAARWPHPLTLITVDTPLPLTFIHSIDPTSP